MCPLMMMTGPSSQTTTVPGIRHRMTQVPSFPSPSRLPTLLLQAIDMPERFTAYIAVETPVNGQVENIVGQRRLTSKIQCETLHIKVKNNQPKKQTPGPVPNQSVPPRATVSWLEDRGTIQACVMRQDRQGK